jgi:hypothetical protein
MRRTYSQIKTRKNNFIVVNSTAWLYPEADIKAGLAATTYKYTYDGNFITCPTSSDIIGVYGAIYNKTTLSQPVGNQGFTIGYGTLLEDMGHEIRFRLTSGQVIVVWRLVKQLTPQKNQYMLNNQAGNSPGETIGYVTTFCSYGSGALGGYSVGLDDVMVVRVG